MTRAAFAALVCASAACADPPPPASPRSPPPGASARAQTDAPREVSRFAATVRVVDEPAPRGGKPFRGVLLEREGGERLVAAYGEIALWRAFDGRRVEVEAEPFTPEGQALLEQHVRVRRFRHAERRDARGPVDYVEVGPEETLRGVFQEERGEPGSKSAGERFVRFVAEDGRSFPALGADDAPIGAPVAVRGRTYDVVQLVSVAGRGGRFFFVLHVAPR